ncbi:MAG TPA: response regulator [Gammaproteobacteria bacterium]|nr:response regulator [Gammaproteobacteria bacterium]
MSPRVLIVDDEPSIVTGLRVFLEDEGMQVGSASSGEEAVDIARNDCSFDVCIMDIRLPGMNGNTAIRALHEICPLLKFIIHTGSAEYSIPDDLRAMGIDERLFFAKPVIDMTPLSETVAALAIGRV